MKIVEYDENFCDNCGEFQNTTYDIVLEQEVVVGEENVACTLCKKCLLKLMYAIIER